MSPASLQFCRPGDDDEHRFEAPQSRPIGSALEITGIDTKATGLIHSEGNLTLRGSGLELTGGVEYAATLDSNLSGSNSITPSPLKVEAGGSPILRDVADFRPGGKFATLAGANYHAIDAFGCVGGVWRPALGQIPTGIIYVPCAVELSGVGTLVDATIAAEGKISIVGSGITVQPFIEFMPGLVTAATGADAILIAGNQVRVDGTIFAPQGTALIAGVGGIYRCGVLAARISIVKANNSFLVDENCRIP